MKLSRILTILAVVLVLMLTFTSCDFIKGLFPGEEHEHHFVEGKCECGETDPEYKPEEKPEETKTTPVITVNPVEMEEYAGNPIADLLFGVTVTDEGDPDVRVVVDDDDGFDFEVPGEYIITYRAVNKFGNAATATRKITILEPLSTITLEVKKNLLGEGKWKGTLISFANRLYSEISADKVVSTAESGIYHNVSDKAVTLTVGGTHGVAAIIDANGVVVEGRDGANSKLVNKDNPSRTGSTVTTMTVDGAPVSVASVFGRDLVIPAGGYAVIVQSGLYGTTVDSDGRGFMNYNVIGTYGNVVRIYWTDSGEELTSYVNQAPTIGGTSEIVVGINDETFKLEDAVLAGVYAKDDKGTFTAEDDEDVTVTILDNGGFDVTKIGKYTITLTATDGEKSATATRVVEVTDKTVQITLGGKTHTISLAKYLYNTDVTENKIAGYSIVVFDKAFEGEIKTNSYGAALVFDQYGRLIKIYDGANLGYYTVDGKAATVHFDVKTYATTAWTELGEGETLVIFPNDGGANVARAWALGHRDLGGDQRGSMLQVVTITGLTFPEPPHDRCESVCIYCGKCLDAECQEEVCAEKCEGHDHECSALCEVCGKCGNAECEDALCAEKCDCLLIVINGKSLKVAAGTIAIDVAAPSLGSTNFIIYTYAFKAENETLSWNNGYAEAFILNQYGQVVRIYDGVSGGKYFDAANRAGIVDATISTAGNTMKDAYASLSEGEILIFGANGGMNGNAGRSFLGGVRVIGALATIPGVTFEALPEHECESKCADCGKCMDKTCIFPACLSQCACHRCESICSVCQGCLDPACTEKACATKCSCHECESLCATCGGCKDTECTNEVCATKCICSYTGTDKYFAVNGTFYKAAEGKWLYNTQCGNTTEPKAQNYKFIIFDKSYKGSFETNAYGVALVVNANGELVKAYDWGAYYDLNGKGTMSHTNANYATYAFSQLSAGETLIIFPNDGANGADSARTFAKNISDNWDSYKGKKVHITGFTFDGVIVHECESICPACGKCLDAECTEAVCSDKCAGHDHICESVCQYCSNCLDKECTEEICTTKCNCLSISIGTKFYNAVNGMWAINETITTGTAANKAVWVFTKDYTGDFSTNGFGVALVLDQFGKVNRIYDGANAGYTDASSGVNNKNYGVTTDNFATLAWESLQAGETLVVLPNGPDSNKARQVGLDCRWLIGQKMSITGVEFASPEKTITIGSKTYTATEGKWLYNTAVTTSTASTYAIVIYDKGFTGEFTTNGFGVALVLTAEGKVARVYDGANAGYTDASSGVNNKNYGVTTDNFAALAWESLQEGETLVILPNGGSEGNAARQVGLDCRWLIGQKMSITGFVFQ